MKDKLPSIKKIAVVRANALGDLIFVVPALQALKETYHAAEIIYLGKKMHSDFIPGHITAVDRVIEIPPYPGVGADEETSADSARVRDFFKKMRAERFDLAIQLHGGGGFSNPFTKSLKARRSLGLKASDAEALDVSVPYFYYQHEVIRYLEVVAAIGAKTKEIEPRITVRRQDLDEAAKHADFSKRFIVLHPGATDIRRQWPTEEFAEVAKVMSRKGLEVFVTGTEAESHLVEAVIKRSGGRAINMCGSLSLGGLTGLLSKASVVVSNDTGPLHLAAAVGAQTVGIFWCGNLINGGPLTRTNHRPQISWTLSCPVCGAYYGDSSQLQRPCEHQVSFVSDVTTSQVLASIESLLDTT